MDFKRFLQVQFAAFVLFGLAFMLIPTPVLEGIYQVDDAGDTAWVRLLGATLLGVGYLEWLVLSNLDGNIAIARAFVGVPLLLTLVLIYTLIAGTDVYNAFFNWSSAAITTFFAGGHLWFARSTTSVG
ncbi:MAG: hypothetical protein OER95_04635 [Acidimicrobiia bacterium]|nr:hypothetical protein [Acidimicrobiia bacterium]